MVAVRGMSEWLMNGGGGSGGGRIDSRSVRTANVIRTTYLVLGKKYPTLSQAVLVPAVHTHVTQGFFFRRKRYLEFGWDIARRETG